MIKENGENKEMTSDICKAKEILQKNTSLSSDEIDTVLKAIKHFVEQLPINSNEVGKSIERIIKKLIV